MLSMITISLLICASSPTIEAPTLPTWPAGLPAPVVSDAGGTLLPPLLADAVHYRLEVCEAMPGRCRVRLIELDAALRGECESRLRLAALDAPAVVSQWRGWLLSGVLGVVVGGGAALWLTR